MNNPVKSGERSAKFLASVMSVDEALVCARAGADIIDCKDARAGALGALPVELVCAIVERMPDTVPVSATVGDLPNEPELVAARVTAVAATGVRYMKVGFFERNGARETIRRLAEFDLGPCELVGLLLADRDPDIDLVADMGRGGFAGAMLDTADKTGGPLTSVLDAAQIREFIDTARGSGLFAGLAGSLRLPDIAPLSRLEPDVLGFRGALCGKHDRRAAIDAGAVDRVREALRSGWRQREERAPQTVRNATLMEVSS